MIRTILFDMGNVLVHFSHDRMCEQMGKTCRMSGPDMRTHLFGGNLQGDFERGRLSPSEFHQLVLRDSAGDVEPDSLRVAASDIFTLNAGMPEILDGLRELGIRLVLLSNTSLWHFEWVRQQFDVLDRFDDVVTSYEAGAIKPEPGIYESALGKIQCSPEECFYTDDIPEYVAKGASVMNWGGLFESDALAGEVKKKRKHCILIWLNGGCSQFETFDMKIGRPTGGPFREISTNVAGSRVCELMPNISQRMDKLAVIRSMRTSQIDHPGGIYLMHTGYARKPNVRFPEIGAIVSKYCGDATSNLPNFVKISSNGNAGSGLLGPQYQPFNLDRDGGLPTFSASRISTEKEARRHELRDFMESRFADRHNAGPVRMHREAYEQSRRLQGVRDVFQTDSEWKKYKTKYGDTKIGRRMMIARCLVEAGVSFVEVGQSGYDTHADNFEGHKSLVPAMDIACRSSFDRPAAQARLWDADSGRLKLDLLKVWTPKIKDKDRIDSYGYARAWSKFIKRGLIAAEFSPDGKQLAAAQAGETSNGQVQLIDVATGKILRTISGHRSGACDVRFSASGEFVLSSGRDTTVRICRAADGKQVASLGKSRGGQFKDWMHAIAIAPDQKTVAAADIAGFVHVWQLV
eukprot:g26665.t1